MVVCHCSRCNPVQRDISCYSSYRRGAIVKKLMKFSIITIPIYCLMTVNIASAASFVTHTGGGFPPYSSGTWNPLTGNGVLAVKSESAESSDYQSFMIGPKLYTSEMHAVAAAAAFGSDTSAGNGILDPRLLGYSIEPMAFASAAASSECTLGGSAYGCYTTFVSSADASASVQHRIMQRGVPDIAPETQGILDALSKVPVRLNYAMAAAVSNPDYPRPSWARAALNVFGDNIATFSRLACSASFVSSQCTSIGEDSGTWAIELSQSTVDRVITYKIQAGAAVSADASSGTGAGLSQESAQAVADPFLYIDPNWVYAGYFMVQQESLLHPGEWAEVTRLWQQPVPEPETWALMLAGLAGMATVRRQRPSQAPAAQLPTRRAG